MSFERIGPYGLSRGDSLAAAFVISFLAGSLKTRMTAYAIVGIGALVLIFAALFQYWTLAAVVVLWLFSMFLVGPLVRSRKNNQQIYLSYEEDGILADQPKLKTLYKWATMESTFRYGSRLYVMVNGACGLVLSERITSSENLDAVKRTIHEHRAAEAAAQGTTA